MAATPAKAGGDQGGRADQLIAAARASAASGDGESAAATAKRAAALPDCTAEDRVEAAGFVAAAGDKTKAVELLLDAGSRFLYDSGDMPKARAAFAQAHALDPTNLDVIFQMGQADVVEGRTQDALAKFIDVLRKSNLKHIPALFEAGCIYQANGQYDQAILAFKKVLDREKTHVQAVVHMGQLHQTKGMVPEALGYYLQAAEMARDVEQLGTAQQLCHMVLALDGANQKARFMLDDINDRAADAAAVAEEAEEEPRASTMAPPPPAAPVATESPKEAPAEAVETRPAAAPAVDDAAVLELDERRARLQKEVEALGGTRLDLEVQLARAKDEAEAAASARSGLLASKAQAEAELAAVNEAIGRARAQADELARRKRDIENETQAAATALHEARQSESAIAASAAKRRAEIESELAELAEHRTREAAALADVRKAADERKKELAALEGATKKLQHEHGAASAAAAEAAQAEAKLRSLHTQASADAESAAQRLADVKRAADEAEARRRQAEAGAADSEAKLRALQAQLAAESDACAKRIAGAKDEAASAEARRDKASGDAAAAEAKLETLREQVKVASAGAADAGKLKQASAKLKEIEAATAAAAAALAQSNAALEATEARKRETDEAYARSKSLAAAADEKRLAAALAADQAEALRAKREADAEALAARLAALETARKDADAQVQLLAAENSALAEVTKKVAEQHAALEAAQTAWRQAEQGKTEAAVEAERLRADCARLKDEAAKARAEVAATRAATDAVAAPQAAAGEPRRRSTDESYADIVVATVPERACADSLRTIESLAAEGEMPFEIAAELAGLIHEGRAVEALRVARARANLEARPAPYLLAVADLSRDLGDASGAREAYKTLAASDPSKVGLVHQRLGQLFLTFADQGTAAALARDDAHYAFAQEPAKALEAYAELVARFPEDPSFRQELGEVHERLGNTDAAALAFSQAIAQYLAGDDAAKAVELAPRLLAARAHDGAALELAARAYERAGRKHEAHKTLDEALAAYREARSAADVERVCRKLADIAEDPVPYRRELALLLKDVGDLGGAAEQLLEAAERLIVWSNAADALVLLREAAVLAADVEPLRERIAAAKERAADAQGSVDAAARGGMFLARGQYEKAAEAYRAAVEKNAYNADACYQLACLLTDRFPDLPTAEQLLENAAELRPGHTATRYRLALVKAARGDVEQAVELLIALARFDENNGDFIDQFVERLEKDADGGSTAAKYRLGIAYRELGRVEEALVILQSIQREAEFIVLCLNAIGLCLRRQGLDTAAAKRFQKAIETPGYPESQYNEALYNLGDLYEGKRDPESLALSLSSYEELYARDCTYRDVADRIKQVKSKLGAAEGPKVKRLPNRSEASNDR